MLFMAATKSWQPFSRPCLLQKESVLCQLLSLVCLMVRYQDIDKTPAISLWCPEFAHDVTGLTSCIATARAHYYFTSMIPALLFEALLCFLMLSKAWHTYKDNSSSPLLNVLIRDRYVKFWKSESEFWYNNIVSYISWRMVCMASALCTWISKIDRCFATILVNCLVWARASQIIGEVVLGCVRIVEFDGLVNNISFQVANCGALHLLLPTSSQYAWMLPP